MTRTQQAMQMILNGATVKAAALAVGISTTAIYTERKRIAGRTYCPCCGQPVKRTPAEVDT